MAIAELADERLSNALPHYLREHEFHWNRRHASDGERTVDAIKGAKGKRLLYRAPAGQSQSPQNTQH